MKTDFSNLQERMQQSREQRNLKLFKTYQKEWDDRQKLAKEELAKRIDNSAKREAFNETRVSIMNHGEKVREKAELNQVIEVLKDPLSAGAWEANLR